MTMAKNKRTTGNIKSDYGIRDYYKFYKEDNPNSKINYSLYVKIIKEYNKGVINLIIEDNVEYAIPHIGSSLVIKCDKRVPKIINGKLHNTTPVDWKATNDLWDSDEEAKSKKLLVRYLNTHSSKYVFRVSFKKYISRIKNKGIYKFQTARPFQRALGNRIKDEDKDPYQSFLIF